VPPEKKYAAQHIQSLQVAAAAFGMICAAAKWSDLHVLQLLGLNSLLTPILIVSSLDFPPKCVSFLIAN
jgi:hypothetical protein